MNAHVPFHVNYTISYLLYHDIHICIYIKRKTELEMGSFSNMCIVNLQMFKFVLEKAEEPEINCQHPLDHQKSKRVPNIYFHFID